MSTINSSRATAIGFLAILLWSGLALLTALTKGVPPFELLALSFGVAFAASLIAYLWPLLIVILSTLMAGEPFRLWQLLGAALGLCGAVLAGRSGRQNA